MFANCFEPPKVLKKKKNPKHHITKGQTYVRKSTQFPFYSPTWFEVSLSKVLQKSTQDFLGHLFICFSLDDLASTWV